MVRDFQTQKPYKLYMRAGIVVVNFVSNWFPSLRFLMICQSESQKLDEILFFFNFHP